MELREELFCEDDFDCYAWAEEALIERGGRVAELAQLVPPLALLSQSLARFVHATLQQLAVTAPQLQTQLDALAAAAAPLHKQLDAVVAHAGNSSGVSAASASDDPIAAAAAAKSGAQDRKQEEERALEHLVALHDAKQRLQACSQVLVEAARWEKNARGCVAAADDIAAELDGPHGAGDTGGDAVLPLADRVHEMRKSLSVLADLPGDDDRRATMQALCARIEAKLAPTLLALLRDDHLAVAKVQRCLEIFRSVDRAEVVRGEFCKCRPSHVHRVWYAFSAQEQELGSWLEVFYGEVHAMLQRESQHIREIFGAASVESVLATLLEATFSVLRASFEDRLRADVRMSTLLLCFQQSTAFAVQTAQLFRSLREKQSLAVLDADDVTDEHASSVDVHSIILASVLEVYQPFFRGYARFAGDALTTELLELAPQFTLEPTKAPENEQEEEDGGVFSDDNNEGALEAFAQRFEDASKRVWTLVDESMKLCYDFSAGAAFPEAVAAVTSAVEQFARTLSATIPLIRQFCNIALTSSESGGRGPVGAIAPDWSRFHAALALLRACGAFESDLCAMEIRVRARVEEQLSHFMHGFERHPSFSSSSPRGGGRKKREQHVHNQQLADLADGNKVVGVVARTWLHADSTRNSAFLQFAHEFGRSATSLEASTLSRAVLFEEAQLALRDWTRGVQLLTFDTVFLPITRLLERVPSMECWTKTPDASLGDLPSFSTLPQEYITTVADLLLSLLPQLEQFAESSSLQQAAVASLGAHHTCVAAHWSHLATTLHLSESEVDACMFIFTPESSETEGGVAAAVDGSESATSSSASVGSKFVDLWTSSVASGTLAALLSAVCAIPSLSALGARQLGADLSYFHNVLSAVSGEPNFVVDDLRHALELSCEDQAQHVETLRTERDLVSSQVLAKLNASLVAKRVRAAGTVTSGAAGGRSLVQF